MFKVGDKVKIDEKYSKYWWYNTDTFTIIDKYVDESYHPNSAKRKKYILNTVVGYSNSKFEDDIRHLNAKELRKQKLLYIETKYKK